jgi:hypothetical protein
LHLFRCEFIAPYLGVKLLHLYKVWNYYTFWRCDIIVHFLGVKLLHLFKVSNYCTLLRCQNITSFQGVILLNLSSCESIVPFRCENIAPVWGVKTLHLKYYWIFLVVKVLYLLGLKILHLFEVWKHCTLGRCKIITPY